MGVNGGDLKRNSKTTFPSQQKQLEQTLWEAADKMRGNLETGDYKHIVLGLIFLKYLSDVYGYSDLMITGAKGLKNQMKLPLSDPSSESIGSQKFQATRLVIPEEARWESILTRLETEDVGQLLDETMQLIESRNPSLVGALRINYSRVDIDRRLLKQLIELFSSLDFNSKDHGSDDVLGQVYEYFLGQFSSSEGKRAGEYYTPRSVVNLLVRMLRPFKGSVYDPCCGTGGMFVQSAEFISAHGGKPGDIRIFGQEFTSATWRLAKMNLAIRGFEADLGVKAADSFHEDLHPELKANFIIANPPFNMSGWYTEDLATDSRWRFGLPPEGNANFAWIQHFIGHLAEDGVAGFVLANGSLSSKNQREYEIREKMVAQNLIDCVVSLPDKLFSNSGIPVCLWFIDMKKAKTKEDVRRDKVLFIDGRNLGNMVSRNLRVLSEDEIIQIASVYNDWHDGLHQEKNIEIPGFSVVANVDKIRENDYILTPGRYLSSNFESLESEESVELQLEEVRNKLIEQFMLSKEIQEKIEIQISKKRY